MQTGQIIAKLRMQAGLSQTQLADALYVSRDLVSKWETGKRRPDRKMLEAMAKIFGVAAEHLIDIDVHKKAENPCATRVFGMELVVRIEPRQRCALSLRRDYMRLGFLPSQKNRRALRCQFDSFELFE